jgi:predicted nucleotidyltransferase
MKTKNKINMQELIDLCKKNGITYLAMFGSYSRGDFSKKSDIDLLVRFSKDIDNSISLLDLVGIEQELSEKLNIKVDLLTEEAISPYIKKYIMSDLRVIYNEG